LRGGAQEIDCLPASLAGDYFIGERVMSRRISRRRRLLPGRLHRELEEDQRAGPGDAQRGRPDRAYAASGRLSAKLRKDFPHGMPTTHADTINADLLAFIKS
jgi:hypothetical protein